MAWMELHQEFRDHTKVKRLALALGISRAEARSMVVSLWLWAVGEARSGDLAKFTPEEIADACHSEEVFDKVDAKKVFAALAETEIIDLSGTKSVLHDWKNHGVRILNDSQKRMKEYRRRLDNNIGVTAANSDRTVTQPLHNSSATVLLSLFLSLSLSLSHTSVLRTPEFAKAWESWFVHRREKRKPLTEAQAKKQLEWLAKQPDPIGIIDESIRQGWQGLFELKDNGQFRRKPTVVERQPREKCYRCGSLGHLGHECPMVEPASEETVRQAVSAVNDLSGKLSAEKDNGTVNEQYRCPNCGELFRDIEQHKKQCTVTGHA